MEDYIREASRMGSVPNEPLLQLTHKSEDAPPSEDSRLLSDEEPIKGWPCLHSLETMGCSWNEKC